jgi:hypothetical protein
LGFILTNIEPDKARQANSTNSRPAKNKANRGSARAGPAKRGSKTSSVFRGPGINFSEPSKAALASTGPPLSFRKD